MDFFDLPLKLLSGGHHFVTAAAATELEIRADAQHIPAVGAAGVLLLQNQYISDTNIHNNYLLSGKNSLMGVKEYDL